MAELIVASRYATALFELAKEQDELDEIYEQISSISLAIENDNSLSNILVNPKITKQEKTDIVNNIFKGRVSKTLLSFFMVLIKKNRESEIKSILLYFIELVKKHKGIIVAKVTSAVKLSDEQLKSIEDKLSKNLNAQVLIESYIDDSIIGGLRINAAGLVIDDTIKTKIDQMKSNLMNIQVGSDTFALI